MRPIYLEEIARRFLPGKSAACGRKPRLLAHQIFFAARCRYGKERSSHSGWPVRTPGNTRSEEHTSELQSRLHLVCRLLLEKKKNTPVKHEQFSDIKLSLR